MSRRGIISGAGGELNNSALVVPWFVGFFEEFNDEGNPSAILNFNMSRIAGAGTVTLVNSDFPHIGVCAVATDIIAGGGFAWQPNASFGGSNKTGIVRPDTHAGWEAAWVFRLVKRNSTISAPPTGASRTANVTTITVGSAHGFAVGDTVEINGVTDASFNGSFVIATVPTTTTFTYANVGPNATSGNGFATVQPGQNNAVRVGLNQGLTINTIDTDDFVGLSFDYGTDTNFQLTSRVANVNKPKQNLGIAPPTGAVWQAASSYLASLAGRVSISPFYIFRVWAEIAGTVKGQLNNGPVVSLATVDLPTSYLRPAVRMRQPNAGAQADFNWDYFHFGYPTKLGTGARAKYTWFAAKV